MARRGGGEFVFQLKITLIKKENHRFYVSCPHSSGKYNNAFLKLKRYFCNPFFLLQAYELGLGTCWIGAFKEDETKKILSVPDDVRVVAMTPLGYPNQPPSQKSRKSLDQIICFEKYE